MRKIKQRLTAVLLLCALCFLYACENVVDFQETESGIYDEGDRHHLFDVQLGGAADQARGRIRKVQQGFVSVRHPVRGHGQLPCRYRDGGHRLCLPQRIPARFHDGNLQPRGGAHLCSGATSLFVERWNAEKKYLDEEYQNVEGLRDDSEYVYAVRDAIISGEEAVLPGTNDIDHDYDYHIRLLSPDYPGLYYLIAFYRDLNGKTYLYDRGSKKTVLCPQNVLGGFSATSSWRTENRREGLCMREIKPIPLSHIDP